MNLLSEAEVSQMVVDWNRTQAEIPLQVCAHKLFEAQVERTPDAIAVEMVSIAEGGDTATQTQRLTYAELNTKANQLAHYLQERGVGPDMLVGLAVERSLELVVGLMGILKAGGAYLPMDTTYPKDLQQESYESNLFPLCYALSLQPLLLQI